jgi:hypothetical protein
MITQSIPRVILVPLMMLGTTAAMADPDHDELPGLGQVGDVSHIDQVIEVDMGEMYFARTILPSKGARRLSSS